jgi:hypothetical protein
VPLSCCALRHPRAQSQSGVLRPYSRHKSCAINCTNLHPPGGVTPSSKPGRCCGTSGRC